MTNDIDLQKLKEDYPEFFEQISPDLLEFILSEETPIKIAGICLANGVEEDEEIEKVASRVVLALLGAVPKENLPEIFEKGVGLDTETAKKMSDEFNQVIFSRMKEIQPIKPSPLSPGEIERPSDLSPLPPEEAIEKPLKKDIYREPIE